MRAMNLIETERVTISDYVKIDTSVMLPNSLRVPNMPVALGLADDVEYNYKATSHGTLRVVLELTGEGLGVAHLSISGNDIAFYMACSA
jgi:hypothetical protein